MYSEQECTRDGSEWLSICRGFRITVDRLLV